MVRPGSCLPERTSPAVTRAISASAPTPEALSLAPGSWTWALKTKRSIGRPAAAHLRHQRQLLATDRAGSTSSARTRTGPLASAARSDSRAA